MKKHPTSIKRYVKAKPKKVVTDLDGAIERCSHIMNHAARLIDKLKSIKSMGGDISAKDVQTVLGDDDDAGAIGWGAMYLCEVTRAIGPKEEK